MSQKSDGQEKQERNQGIRIALDRMIRQAIARTISDIYKEVLVTTAMDSDPAEAAIMQSDRHL